jgi:glycosyltransferase involved in cell wall biosynthesis
MKTAVIVPAFNEHRHIADVITQVKTFNSQVIVVDDGSRDGTAAVAEKTGVVVLKHAINLGKGAALRTGSEYALQKGAEILIYIDSDGQHNPADIPRLLNALPGNDVVFTYRDLRSAEMPATKKLGNLVLNTLMKLLFGIAVRDTQCGFKAMTAAAYRRMRLISFDYNIESEMVAKAGKHKLRFVQEPIHTVYADKYKGTTVFHGAQIALRMLWWKFIG